MDYYDATAGSPGEHVSDYFDDYLHTRSPSLYSDISSQRPLSQSPPAPSQSRPQSQFRAASSHGPHSSSLSQQHSKTSSINSATANTVDSRASLSRVRVPSFSVFRSQAPSVPLALKQKTSQQPLSHVTSASLSALPAPANASPRIVEPTTRPHSLDERSAPRRSGAATTALAPLAEDAAAQQRVRTSYVFPIPGSGHDRTVSISSRMSSDTASSAYSPKHTSDVHIHTRYASDDSTPHATEFTPSAMPAGLEPRRPSQTAANGGLEAPSMTLQLDCVKRTLSNESLGVVDSQESERPRSPAGRLGSFFGWKSTPSPKLSADSPSTTFSERSMSPLPSPQVNKPLPPIKTQPAGVTVPHAVDITKTDNIPSSYFDSADVHRPPGAVDGDSHIKALERELAQVSAELAASIRREMDLEDDLERIRIDGLPIVPSDSGRRGSDYFSDSGYSSARFPITDYDAKMEQLERSARKAEQEKANIKLEMAARLQTELSRRRELEEMVQSYEMQLQRSIFDHSNHDGLEERVESLESTLEDTRRLLNQERQAKGSFEDLYSATRGELEQHKNERDNLRDEVVPQLRARIQGLESEAAEKEALVYENSRMQQELALLRQKIDARYGMIIEEDSSTPLKTISRSSSLARNHSKRGGSLTRSGSVRDVGRQRSGSNSMPVTAESMKEIEDQRDALHKALKLLISRHEKQRRDHERLIKKMNASRSRDDAGPGARSPYHKEVTFLKEEVTTLRKRTEDALEAKFQYEKNLAGIKMDLDRAEQETRGLRNLLQQHDILAPSPSSRTTFDDIGSEQPGDEQLTATISKAESERDSARQAAEQYRESAKTAEGDAAIELKNSARRMDELADELDKQVQSNVKLRRRLTAAVMKGESEQRESGLKIEEMQKRLAGLEDSVIAAQQHSEATLGNHEADVRQMEEATSPALQRLTIKIPDGQRLNPTNGHHLGPLSPAPIRSPVKLLGSKKLADSSLLEASRTHMLERKVRELEGLLREAEQDMQDVVQRVNASQLEVAELQTERDAAVTMMRRLQDLVVEEREKAERWQT